jgi:hypothetical protein
VRRWILLFLLVPAVAYAHDQYGANSWRSLKALYSDGSVCLTGPCDLAAGTTLDGAAIGGGGVSDGDKGDITVSGSGAAWAVDSGAVAFSELSGSATDAQIPDTITASNYQLIATDLTRLIDNCDLENDSTPIPDSCVGDGADGGGGGGAGYAEIAAAALAGF